MGCDCINSGPLPLYLLFLRTDHFKKCTLHLNKANIDVCNKRYIHAHNLCLYVINFEIHTAKLNSKYM